MTRASISNDLVDNFAPAIPGIMLSQSGAALAGARCVSCGQNYLEAPMQCPKCLGQDLDQIMVADEGIIHSFTTVHRSFPKVVTPFIMVLVELDDGIFIRGRLDGVDISDFPKLFGERVKLIFVDSGQIAPDEKRFLAYAFVLSRGSQ